ncbi:MAG: hypothetical protein AAFQ80_05085 [Cyanobacteria bacterium J06621_8]
MSDRVGMICGFLGGTIVAVESGYKVFPHPKSDKIYQRLSEAKWFLALSWCDSLSTPAGIINNTGQLSFINHLVLKIGEQKFIPQQYRLDVFDLCMSLKPNEITSYQFPVHSQRSLEIQALEIDARYGKVALVREVDN